MKIQKIDYNKPKFSNILGRDLDNTIIKADEWYLKPQHQQTGVHTYDRTSGHFNNDISYNNSSVIVVGTELQINNKFCYMLRKHGWQLQDSWDRELKPNWESYYINNGRIPIIINIK